MSSLVRPTAKDLGAYYTPDTMADILAAWVVRTGRETLLEPSIGSGALLRAALNGAERRFPGRDALRLIGCDLDQDAITKVRGWLAPQHALLFSDFLAIEPGQVPLVDGVISNPPFTRNHALPKAERQAIRKRFGIKGAAGLWVAFVLHSLSFLRPGGRLAVVVPGAAIFSAYGRDALERICSRFAHVEIRKIVDRPVWSSPAEERGAIILAHGFGEGASEVPEVTRWSATGDRLADIYHANPACFRNALAGARTLGEIATLSIGAVTGFNKVFLLSEPERAAAGIEVDDLTPVVARARHVVGLQISTSELHGLAKAGEKTWLLSPADVGKTRPGVRGRLASIPIDKRRDVVWLNKRSPWWKVDVGASCDAIFTYMNDRGPRIVVATDELRCTNTLHRVRFLPEVTAEDRLVAALSMISSFGQLAAERTGRAYGGGVLKFELTDARRFPLLMGARAGTRRAFEEADRAVRSGDLDAARRIADALLLPSVFGPSWRSAAAEMFAEALEMRSARRENSAHE
jgi:adenine-specific DNA-methyltransferase